MSENNITMESIVDPSLLDKIDKLFACGVGEYIALPQLVVVGDQSSGKSSVLEGITNLPFPRDSGLCTRFATQITFRRAESVTTTVSIIPRKDAPQDHVDKLRDWKTVTNTHLDPVTFSRIMVEVHTIMGLGQKDTDNVTTFSEDVLKVEVSGPDCQHFSVVDVPGIFRTATKGVTTLEDAAMVKAMVWKYMENPRSVMLAVIPANVDIATQEILTMAEETDPEGHRTLGVLTKPDLVDPGTEHIVAQLVQGTRHPLNLGWCIVRNPGQQNYLATSAKRSAAEAAFFKLNAQWSKLGKDRVGTDALRSRLQEILASNIRREFTLVKREINARLVSAKRNLHDLGTQRQSPEEQRRFVMDISSRFREIASLAVSSNYSGSNWFKQGSNLMLVNSVAKRNERFNDDVERCGATYAFNKDYEDERDDRLSRTESSDGYDEGGQSNDRAMGKQGVVVKRRYNLALRTTNDLPDLEDIITGDRAIDGAVQYNILGWLSDLYESSRGLELGTFDKDLLAQTMNAQSAKWEHIARGYILDIIHFVHCFIVDVLRLVCPSARARECVLSVMMEPLLDIYRNALQQVDFIMQVERNNPLTVNHYFNDNLEDRRLQRLRASLSDHAAFITDANKRVASSMISLSNIVRYHPMSNAKHTIWELHDTLEAYYKVARKRFVDNICMQAADFQLVTGPRNPLKLFSPQFVGSLSDEQLEEIAGEDAGLIRKRATLKKEVADLELGKKILGWSA